MIRDIVFEGGYPSKLPCLSGRKIEFDGGLNVLFGENGCGKTTIIKGIAAYSLVPVAGGWSRMSESLDYWICGRGSRLRTYPELIARLSKSDMVPACSWDGSPSYSHSNNKSTDLGDILHGMDDGLVPIELALVEAHLGSSAGQKRMMRLNKLFGMLARSVPSVYDATSSDGFDEKHPWRRATEFFRKICVERLEAWDGEKKPTILFDEPDASLSIPNQMIFWTKWMPKLGEEFQVVAATHSPFSLFCGANVIDVSGGGYVEASRRAVSSVVGGSP